MLTADIGRECPPLSCFPCAIGKIRNMRPWNGWRLIGLAALVLAAAACDSTEPTPVSSLTIGTPAPGPGSIIPTTLRGIQYFVDRGNGAISIPITVTSGREVPWAQLNVYLYFGPGEFDYCGQNNPDAPTWGPFAKGQTVSVTISGFQLGRASCTVTSLRAYLHTRNNGSGTPPISSETVAQGSRDVNLTFAVR